jgi:hypothetical protein
LYGEIQNNSIFSLICFFFVLLTIDFVSIGEYSLGDYGVNEDVKTFFVVDNEIIVLSNGWIQY